MKRTGTMEAAGDRWVLRFERRLAHPVEKVWRAITEPAHLEHWFPADVHMELRLGAAIRFVFREGQWPDTDGAITQLDPPRLLEFTWSGEILRWELRPEPDGCTLFFAHTVDDRAGAASFASGWDGCLDALGRVLDGDPESAPAVMTAHWADRHEEYVARFGLGEGTLEETADGWTARFTRQLTHPIDKVWSELIDGELAVGGPPPLRLTNGHVTPGAITALESRAVEFAWLHGGEPAGRVRWALSEGTGGARIALEQTVPRGLPDERFTALAAWHTQLELFARHLRGEDVCPWPAERTEELRAQYADRLRD